MSRTSGGLDFEELIRTSSETQVVPPSLYKVILNNDDYTPMEFVIEVLQLFFNMDLEKATQIMLTVHYHGKGVCGIFTAEVAETKMVQVNQFAKENEQPLLCTMEKA